VPPSILRANQPRPSIMSVAASPTTRPNGAIAEVFFTFLRLGCTSFGGPIAHLGYYRAEFVARRRWLDERAFADLVGLAQFLPGPASSQTGFAIGLRRAGYLGGLAAWTGFTLPSAVLLVLFAYGAAPLAATVVGAGLLHGLKLVAVAIVAQAVWGMARSLAPDRTRASIAVAAVLVVVAAPAAIGQLAAIALGAATGLVLCRDLGSAMVPEALAMPVSRRVGWVCLVLFCGLLVVPPLLHPLGVGTGFFDAFYRCGALVFGGGHVVLPLLREAVVAPGWVSDSAFLAGYGATQAVPGPVFTFAAYLGAIMHGVPGAAVALVAIFLPGLLLMTGALPFWDALRARPAAQAAMRGINAAVVGVLGAALYDPIWTTTVRVPADFALALVGFVLLTVWRAPPLVVVGLGALAGIGLALG
jgi:chromate transporter